MKLNCHPTNYLTEIDANSTPINRTDKPIEFISDFALDCLQNSNENWFDSVIRLIYIPNNSWAQNPKNWWWLAVSKMTTDYVNDCIINGVSIVSDRRSTKQAIRLCCFIIGTGVNHKFSTNKRTPFRWSDQMNDLELITMWLIEEDSAKRELDDQLNELIAVARFSLTISRSARSQIKITIRKRGLVC